MRNREVRQWIVSELWKQNVGTMKSGEEEKEFGAGEGSKMKI